MKVRIIIAEAKYQIEGAGEFDASQEEVEAKLSSQLNAAIGPNVNILSCCLGMNVHTKQHIKKELIVITDEN